MDLLKSLDSLQKWRRNIVEPIAFIPTMGALHAGHASLVREAKQSNTKIVVSIFVNPTQFAAGEDLNEYPQTLDQDLNLLNQLEVDAVFLPNASMMYPDGFDTFVRAVSLNKILCGRNRPIHFDGVLTIVIKLFNLIRPHRAYFGKKDYQQLKMIERAVRDLNLNIKIFGCEIHREPTGLAMSSRNSYLSQIQKEQASLIYKELSKARDLVDKGAVIDSTYIKNIKAELLASGFVIDYVELCERHSLKKMNKSVKSASILLVAAKLENVRLIDNIEL